MGGWITLTMITIGMYRIAEHSKLSGWVWASVTIGLFFFGSLLLTEIPRIVIVGLCGLTTFMLMFGYKIAFDK